MTLYEKIPLPNGLTMEVWDYSRKIARDTTKVELAVQMEVPFAPEYFTRPEHYEKTIRILGEKGLYEYRKERTFVKNEDKEKVFQELLDTFKRDSLPYLSREDFPRRFARSKHREIEQHWYRYITPPEESE
ncbi:MAG: hypothetical protein N2Z74_00925 [Syntrophales bacterium]|nr:hypothetical protein [Syntrophales bacterium]